MLFNNVECPLCYKKIASDTIGAYYNFICSCGNYRECHYHYGHDVIIKDKIFHFDDLGYGWEEARVELEKAVADFKSEQK